MELIEDANYAGVADKWNKCTLILAMGNSAEILAAAGLGVISRDFYGIFPLHGKIINVRDAHETKEDNELGDKNLGALMYALGLDHTKPNCIENLRYGKVMLMADQDPDGSHLKGLVINLFHYYWPQLLKKNFLEQFIAPAVCCQNETEALTFFSIPEFEQWKSETEEEQYCSYFIKYYRELGSLTAAEMKVYFADLQKYRIKFTYNEEIDEKSILMAFSKDKVKERKNWITNFMNAYEGKGQNAIPHQYLYRGDGTKTISISDFINFELVSYAYADIIRSIPSLIDGFKLGQRKVFYTCLERDYKEKIKFAQLIGSVMELTAYYVDNSMIATIIIKLAQDFVGSNNINLLEPIGQFGSRLKGGKDSANPKSLSTKLSPITRLIFRREDDNLLTHQYYENLKCEPQWYVPIIPMLLVNGSEGMATGWRTKIHKYNPRDIIMYLLDMLNKRSPTPLLPWYKNFRGTIKKSGKSRFIISGLISVIGTDEIEITELPVGLWTHTYKSDILKPLLLDNDSPIQDCKEYNTDSTIKFVVTFKPDALKTINDLYTFFKIQVKISTLTMCALDERGILKEYSSVEHILEEFFIYRLKIYAARKNQLENIIDEKIQQLASKTPEQFWKEDLQELLNQLDREASHQLLREPACFQLYKEASPSPNGKLVAVSEVDSTDDENSEDECGTSKRTFFTPMFPGLKKTARKLRFEGVSS